jgi:hypothetical protein
MSYCVTLFRHTSKMKHEYWSWLSFRANVPSVSAALQPSLCSVLIYCRWNSIVALTKIMRKFIILWLQNWRRVINKLYLASVLFILISRKLFCLTNVAVASCGLGYREERSRLGGRPRAQWTTGRSDKQYWSDKLMILIHEYGDTVSKYSFAVGVRMKWCAGVCSNHKTTFLGRGELTVQFWASCKSPTRV